MEEAKGIFSHEENKMTFESDIDRKACPMPCSLGQGTPKEKRRREFGVVKINVFPLLFKKKKNRFVRKMQPSLCSLISRSSSEPSHVFASSYHTWLQLSYLCVVRPTCVFWHWNLDAHDKQTCSRSCFPIGSSNQPRHTP